MNLNEYIEQSKFKPLTEKELKKGKNKIKIFGTKVLMPWDEVYTRISAGMSLEHIAEIYGNGRQIALWAKEDDIDVDEDVSQFLDNSIVVGRQMNQIESKNPVVANTLRDMVSEYAPDIARDVALFSKAAVARASTLINDEECTSNDFKNVMSGMLNLTDMTSLTERHSTNAGNANLNIHVEGFEFQLDAPPEEPIIDAEVSE